MSRQVTHDGNGALQVRFSFDRDLVDRIKTLPSRRWNAAERHWRVPEDDVVLLVDLLCGERFRFDDATRRLYEATGGTADIPAESPAPARTRPAMPGLFDEPETTAAEAEPGRGNAGDYTVATLNERVSDVLADAFPSPVWLVGEIAGFNKSSHRKHVGFELVELKQSGETASKIGAILFDGKRRQLERDLKKAGGPFRLEDEVSVRLQVRVSLHVPWGQYRVVVESIDVNYTLGEAARRREEIVRRLAEQGLIGLNSALPLPQLPLRVGLITSLQSDAYNDVLRTLKESGFAFHITAHGARVQGHSTEPSVLNALDRFRGQAEELDVVLICRGGGSRTDLIWFDSEPLGRAVARFPLPVVVGIGHEQDQSVLDAVGRSCKTPTAAARLLVDAVGQSQEQIERRAREILDGARRATLDERRRAAERGRRLALATRGLIQRERERLDHRRRGCVSATRRLLDSARRILTQWGQRIPREAERQLTRRRIDLQGARRAILQGSRRELETARRNLARLSASLPPAASRRVGHERERNDARAQRLRLVDPERVLERGYAILRLEKEGSLVTRPATAPTGTALRARLAGGVLRVRSEGEVDENPNEAGEGA